MQESVLIVGTSIGGVTTALSLRSQGFEGQIVLMGEETDLPYDKPPLTKQYLSGAWQEDRCRLLTEDAAGDARIELRLGEKAVHLDVNARIVTMESGAKLGYQSLVIATGASARESPWMVESGLHVIRTMEHARALRADLEKESPVVVVGGGFVGMEVASTAQSLGRNVTIVDPVAWPMARAVGAEMSELMGKLHQQHAVDIRFGIGVREIRGAAGDLRVELTSGETLRAGTVVVGIGATPNDEWLQDSGLDIADGVICDEFGGARGTSDVFAVGDVARWFDSKLGSSNRIEHWTNASEQAAHVAHNLLNPGNARAYRPTHYIWSDQFNCKLQILGHLSEQSKCAAFDVMDGDRVRALALFSDDSVTLSAAAMVNWPKAFVLTRRLLANGASIREALDSTRALDQSDQGSVAAPAI